MLTGKPGVSPLVTLPPNARAWFTRIAPSTANAGAAASTVIARREVRAPRSMEFPIISSSSCWWRGARNVKRDRGCAPPPQPSRGKRCNDDGHDRRWRLWNGECIERPADLDLVAVDGVGEEERVGRIEQRQ